jgi:hypothetical protein
VLGVLHCLTCSSDAGYCLLTVAVVQLATAVQELVACGVEMLQFCVTAPMQYACKRVHELVPWLHCGRGGDDDGACELAGLRGYRQCWVRTSEFACVAAVPMHPTWPLLAVHWFGLVVTQAASVWCACQDCHWRLSINNAHVLLSSAVAKSTMQRTIHE